MGQEEQTGGLSISVQRSPADPLVERVTESVLPTRHGIFRIVGYRTADGGAELVSLSQGIVDDRSHSGAPLVRLHSECLTGDAFGSWRCDCGEQLDAALALIAQSGEGVLVYLRGHEGRGIGLVEKLRAYRLQDQGLDTVDANLRLGHPVDARDYGQAAAILRDLGIDRVRLLSSNPAKEEALRALGVIVVERVGAAVPERPENAHYLQTKRQRMRHDGVVPVAALRPGSDVSVPSAPHRDAVVVDGAFGRLGNTGAGSLPAPPTSGLADEPLANGDGTAPDSFASRADGAVTDELSDDSAGPYAWLVQHQDWVVAQSAQSLDGFLATRSGDGAGLSGAADHRHLHRLRALADAVIVGAQTVVNDDPLLTVRLASGGTPIRVVLDPHARVPATARVLSQPDAPTLWLTGPAGTEIDGTPASNTTPDATGDSTVPHETGIGDPPSHLVRIRLGAPPWSPGEVLDVLRARGVRRVLVEGGGRTVSSFLAADALDRLFLTTVPVLLGEGVRGVRIPGVDRVADAPRWPMRRFTLGDDTCLEFTLR